MASQVNKGAAEEYEEHKETLAGLNGHRLSKKIAKDHLKKDPDYYKESKEKNKMADAGKWMQAARDRMEKKGTVGSLRKAAGVGKEGSISEEKLDALESKGKGMKDESGKLSKRGLALVRKVNFARNARK